MDVPAPTRGQAIFSLKYALRAEPGRFQILTREASRNPTANASVCDGQRTRGEVMRLAARQTVPRGDRVFARVAKDRGGAFARTSMRLGSRAQVPALAGSKRPSSASRSWCVSTQCQRAWSAPSGLSHLTPAAHVPLRSRERAADADIMRDEWLELAKKPGAERKCLISGSSVLDEARALLQFRSPNGYGERLC